MQLIKRLAAVLLCAAVMASCSAIAVFGATADQTADSAEIPTEPIAAETVDPDPAGEDISVEMPEQADPPSNILGDIDSDFAATIDDAYYLMLHYAGIITLPDSVMQRSDANLDGVYSLVDATYIQGCLAGLERPFYVGVEMDRIGTQVILDSINYFEYSKGVDISEFNGDVDMNKIKAAGYTFVMIRLGYGDDEVSQDDKKFEQNVRLAEEAGLDWGAYIYSYALSVNEAKSEVNHTLRLLEGKTPTMPIAFDWEDDSYKARMGMPSNTVVREICRTYLSGIADAGYYPMLYTGYSWLKGAFNHPDIIDTYDIWYAQWYTSYDYKDRPLGMWQYGGEENFIESPYIDGLKGAFDKNYAYKNYPMIIKAYGYNNHEPILHIGPASTSAHNGYDGDIGHENLPDYCNGVMGDSLRNKQLLNR